METTNEIILHPRKTRAVISLLLGIFLIPFGSWGIIDSGNPGGWVMLGLGIAFGGWGLFLILDRKAYLKAGPEGLEISTKLQKAHYPWKAISNFRVVEIELRRTKLKLVGYDVLEGVQGLKDARRAENRKLTGADDNIPPSFYLRPEDFVKKLEEWKDRFTFGDQLEDPENF